MKRIEWFMNMLYYCNYMIRYKIRSSFDYLFLSIFDNACTRKFCKSDRYWKYVSNMKRANNIMWSKRKGFPYNIHGGTYRATFLFVIIILFIVLNMIEAITHIPVYYLIFYNVPVGLIVSIILCGFLSYLMIDRLVEKDDKYISYFKKFGKQKFWKLFIWYVLSYGVAIACCYLSLILIL